MNHSTISAICKIVRDICRHELSSRIDSFSHRFKADGSLLTELDLALNDNIRNALFELEPGIAFLSEEMSVSEQIETIGSGKDYWCLDPLDGTSNFVAGVPYFCVSLALVQNGLPTCAVVFDPMRDELFAAEKNRGATLNSKTLKPPKRNLPLSKSIGLVDFKRLSEPLKLKLVTSPPYASQRNFGACALEWCWMAAGRGHVYLHGGQKLWDYAAGLLIFSEAGGKTQTFNGEAIFNNTLEPRPVVAAMDESLFYQWRDWISSFTNEGPR